MGGGVSNMSCLDFWLELSGPRFLCTVRTLGIKIAQKPYIVWSLGRKALKYESLDPEGYRILRGG